jgi:hypothetical protein
MGTAKIRIVFDVDSKQPITFERKIEMPRLRDDGGREFVAETIFSQFAKDVNYEAYRLALPPVENFLRPVNQSFRPEEIMDAYPNRVNTKEMWWEIGNTFLRVQHLLGTSRAYHDEELAHDPVKNPERSNPEGQNLAYWFHLEKMIYFDLGIILLQKVRDLAARLIFERLGESLIRVDKTNPGWEQAITPGNVRQGLVNKTGKDVAELSDQEHATLLEILDDLRKTEDGTKLQTYRNKFVHRITPSVDRPELYTFLQRREWTPIFDENDKDKIKGWTKGIGESPTTATYAFLELYENAVQTLSHYIDTLKRLEAMPRFGPEASSTFAASA